MSKRARRPGAPARRPPPSPRQQEALDFVRYSLETRGVPPSAGELAEHLGITSSTALILLGLLERKGYLVREPGKLRALRLIDQSPDRLKIPVLGHVDAGGSHGDAQPHVYVDRFHLPPVAGSLYALAVVGDDLATVGVRDGDFVICHKQSTAVEGDVSIPSPVDGVSVVGEACSGDQDLVGVVVGVYRTTD